jgi:phosphohistidine phosphatase SixA
MRYLLRLTIVAIFLCQVAAAQASHIIFLVRHAEKTSAEPDAPLSAAGQKRAECLVQTLKDSGIKQIFVTDAKRAQQTADPIAKALKLKPSIIPARDVSTLSRSLLYSTGGNQLVIAHSDTLPVIIARLQGGTIKPIGENEYDRLFMVTVVEAAGTPAAMLRYCDIGTTPAARQNVAPAKPAATAKPSTAKPEPKKP